MGPCISTPKQAAPSEVADSVVIRQLPGAYPELAKRWSIQNDFSTWPGITWDENGVAGNVLKIDLSGCGLKECPWQLGELNSMTHLDLSGNDFHTLPPELSQAKAVTHLNLSGSNVGLAEDGSSDGPLPEWVYTFKLKELILTDCGKLNDIDVARFPSLETLNIDGTQFLNWKFVFIKCGGRKNLKTISARNLPALGDLPEELAQCTSLESLDVSGCNFTSLPSMFTNKELARGMKLKTLVMTNNKLKELPDGLKYLESIETMNFQNNDIKQVDMDIGSDLPNLKRVDLTKNPLKKVPPPVWKKKEEGIILVDDNVKEGINADDAMEMAQDKAQEAKKAAQKGADEAKKAAKKAMGSIKKMF